MWSFSAIHHILISLLTHWGQMTHIYVSKLTTIGSDNGFSPGQRQAIIWTNSVILSIGPSGTNVSGILIAIHTFSLKKMCLKTSSGNWWLFCLGLNVLIRPAHGDRVCSEDRQASSMQIWKHNMWPVSWRLFFVGSTYDSHRQYRMTRCLWVVPHKITDYRDTIG